MQREKKGFGLQTNWRVEKIDSLGPRAASCRWIEPRFKILIGVICHAMFQYLNLDLSDFGELLLGYTYECTHELSYLWLALSQ